MQDKKIFTLIILSAIAIIMVTRGMTARPKSRLTAASGGPGVYQAARELGGGAAAAVRRRAKRSQFTNTGRNPFLPKGSGRTSSGMALGGIVESGKTLKAMIGDAVVGKGDKIGTSTVIEVRSDRVILNDGTKDFEIKMEQ